jgi:sugar-specific transcriptional regulator TrmB
MCMLREALQELGLSENEISIYLALNKIGKTSTTKISQVAGIKRSTTFDNLQSLSQKGLVVSQKVNLTTYYEASSPNTLLTHIEEKRAKIKSVIPELEKLRSIVPNDSELTSYEGKKGVISVLHDMISVKKDVLMIGSRAKTMDLYDFHAYNFILKRVDAGILFSILYSEEDRKTTSAFSKKIRDKTKIKYIKGLEKSAVDIFIYGNNVSFITLGSVPSGVIIRNAFIASQQKLVFELLWKNAKK